MTCQVQKNSLVRLWTSGLVKSLLPRQLISAKFATTYESAWCHGLDSMILLSIAAKLQTCWIHGETVLSNHCRSTALVSSLNLWHFNMRLTRCLLDVTRVCNSKENISSTFLKFGTYKYITIPVLWTRYVYLDSRKIGKTGSNVLPIVMRNSPREGWCKLQDEINPPHTHTQTQTQTRQWRTQEFCSGEGGVQQIQLRTERERGSGGGTP